MKEIHTFGLVDGTAPWDGMLHRGGNNIYPVAFGSILDGALDEVFDHPRMDGVYLMRIVGDTFGGGLLSCT
jgi:hypothetical protein